MSGADDQVLPVGICVHRDGFRVRHGDKWVGQATDLRGAKRKLAEHLEVPVAKLPRREHTEGYDTWCARKWWASIAEVFASG